VVDPVDLAEAVRAGATEALAAYDVGAGDLSRDDVDPNQPAVGG
jgi:hypothetical protein